MPTSTDSRCSVSIPFGATGEDSELCGADTTQSCENCGVICTSCAETFPCPLVSEGKHVFLAPQQLTSNPTPTPATVLDAMILNAISDQLPKGWSGAHGVWWPLLIEGQELMICGNTVMTADDLSQWLHARGL